MEAQLIQFLGVLTVSMAVAIGARRFKLPYTVGLVLVGAILAMTSHSFGAPLTRELIFNAILPPLLFEAALFLEWRKLRVDMLPILVLAILGTIVAAATVTAGMVWLLDWPVAPALLFGVLIAATDPVAVIAMFKDNNIKGRLLLLVESESLFNDGVAAVLFTGALAWQGLPGQEVLSTSAHAVNLFLTIAGGFLVGGVVGGLAMVIVGRSRDHLIEGAVTAVAAYGSFLLAQYMEFSGVLACVTAGMLMGNLGVLRPEDKNPLSVKGREFVMDLWTFFAFVANSLIFPLIGVTVAQMPFQSSQVPLLAATICIVLFSRAMTVYPLCLAFAKSRWAVPMRDQHALWWGGLRGALGLALVMSLPLDLPMRDEIVTVTFGVVAFSIVVQGLTMPLLLRKLKLLPSKRD